jgi:hypothetical protein
MHLVNEQMFTEHLLWVSSVLPGMDALLNMTAFQMFPI